MIFQFCQTELIYDANLLILKREGGFFDAVQAEGGFCQKQGSSQKMPGSHIPNSAHPMSEEALLLTESVKSFSQWEAEGDLC